MPISCVYYRKWFFFYERREIVHMIDAFMFECNSVPRLMSAVWRGRISSALWKPRIPFLDSALWGVESVLITIMDLWKVVAMLFWKLCCKHKTFVHLHVWWCGCITYAVICTLLLPKSLMVSFYEFTHTEAAISAVVQCNHGNCTMTAAQR